MSAISERVQKIVAEHLDLDPEEVTEYSNFIDDLGTDSLDTVELIMAFEDEFGCLIPHETVPKIVTVKDAINFIEAQKAIPQHR
jgi:acyl carrier protein